MVSMKLVPEIMTPKRKEDDTITTLAGSPEDLVELYPHPTKETNGGGESKNIPLVQQVKRIQHIQKLEKVNQTKMHPHTELPAIATIPNGNGTIVKTHHQCNNYCRIGTMIHQ
jgi:hypothetical protein